jgi:hypothetical protein
MTQRESLSEERRLCTAEVRGSNPLGSTPKTADLQGKLNLRVSSWTANPVHEQQRRGEGEKAVINEVYELSTAWLD